MGKGKYRNTLEELRDTRNFAKLATVYRHLAKFRDGIAAAAPNVPHGALDPTLNHLDKTLKDYRDLASDITGYPVQDGDLRINLGDEFGAAATPDTGQHASVDTSKIDVIREMAAARPFDEKSLTAWDLNSVAVTTSNAAALYGTGPGGALAVVSKTSMLSAEAQYTWDAFAEQLESHPAVQEARGCLNRWLIGAGVAGAVVTAGVIGGIILSRGGGDGDDAAVAGDTTAQAGDDEAPGIFDGFSVETQGDLSYFTPRVVGFQAGALYVESDPAGDPFNSFGDDVPFEDRVTELIAGYGGRFKIGTDVGNELTCGEETSTGMTVVCMEGVTGALPAGDYVIVAGSLENALAGWKPTVEYKFNAFFEDRGRALAFPEGDPRPEFPYNTLIRTNSFLTLGSTGGDAWTLTGRWSEGQQFRPWAEAPATDNTAAYIRGALGGNTFVFVAPSELFSGMTYYNVGTEAHPAGEEYSAQNTTQDVLGANPQGMKPMLYDLLTMEEDDEEGGPPIVPLLRDRLDGYVQWVREGNGAELSAHLDRSAYLRWGEDTCGSFFGRVAPDDSFDLEVLDVRGPVTWDWEIYGLRVGTLFDAYEFDVNLTQQGTTQQVTGHFAWDEDDEDIRIFSPCVTAQEGAAELAAAQAPQGAPPGGAPPASGADVDRIRSLIPGYEMARRDGSDTVYDYLHPAVIDYYGEGVCRDFYANQVGPDPSFAFGAEVRVTGPAAYTYMPGGVTVGSADNVYSFVMDTTIGGQTQPFTWRFALVDGALKTFQPCRR